MRKITPGLAGLGAAAVTAVMLSVAAASAQEATGRSNGVTSPQHGNLSFC